MAKHRSFEQMVLEARAVERERYAGALANARGPMAYSKTLSEDDQDEMWQYMAPEYADPAAFARLTLPKDRGGQGLTPLAASLERYPHRRLLYEGAGRSIEDQIKYSRTRQERIAAKGLGAVPAAPVAPALPAAEALAIPAAPDATSLPSGPPAPGGGVPRGRLREGSLT